ncbi:dinuclear metal center protein, YbgI/SA1388 family [Alteribacillus persepolensis]|uniref:GTP cyclohydrolase 1 type 2 homolog n=1 Tax=Alteribacillus persepolensis TaxID=568899 RepID=A0A1G8CT52_9BACI|nr:Nif3-like dinuclear metal center hexameric protein [Alteribacillus persepolensis]SDH48443.1 dinuclear metal center protein, YbgI/SA1388 family [Alteribacillus persepolensis]
MKPANGQMIIQQFEQFSPKSLAVDGDKIGLMVGTLNKPVHKVMIALDVLEEVIDEAIEKEADLIIAHHPLIFKPLKHIDTSKGQGPIIEKCIKHDITVYAAHTNLDIAKGGVNDMMAEALQLQDTDVLVPTQEAPLKKLVAFTPLSHVDQVRQALGDAGAGYIGDYSHCTFSAEGTGTFIPGEGTNPYLGKQGEMEFASEKRIETVVPENLLKRVVRALEKAHPYEEPAYDIYPLDLEGETMGLGRIGTLEETVSLEEFVSQVKTAFDVEHVRAVGSLAQPVKKVAVLGGDGNKYWMHAKRQGADVYVTGDLYYHVAHDAKMDGLNMIDPGHNVEKIMKNGVKKKMEELIDMKKYSTSFIASSVSTDPFTFL